MECGQVIDVKLHADNYKIKILSDIKGESIYLLLPVGIYFLLLSGKPMFNSTGYFGYNYVLFFAMG